MAKSKRTNKTKRNKLRTRRQRGSGGCVGGTCSTNQSVKNPLMAAKQGAFQHASMDLQEKMRLLNKEISDLHDKIIYIEVKQNKTAQDYSNLEAMTQNKKSLEERLEEMDGLHDKIKADILNAQHSDQAQQRATVLPAAAIGMLRRTIASQEHELGELNLKISLYRAKTLSINTESESVRLKRNIENMTILKDTLERLLKENQATLQKLIKENPSALVEFPDVPLMQKPLIPHPPPARHVFTPHPPPTPHYPPHLRPIEYSLVHPIPARIVAAAMKPAASPLTAATPLTAASPLTAATARALYAAQLSAVNDEEEPPPPPPRDPPPISYSPSNIIPLSNENAKIIMAKMKLQNGKLVPLTTAAAAVPPVSLRGKPPLAPQRPQATAASTGIAMGRPQATPARTAATANPIKNSKVIQDLIKAIEAYEDDIKKLNLIIEQKDKAAQMYRTLSYNNQQNKTTRNTMKSLISGARGANKTKKQRIASIQKFKQVIQRLNSTKGGGKRYRAHTRRQRGSGGCFGWMCSTNNTGVNNTAHTSLSPLDAIVKKLELIETRYISLYNLISEQDDLQNKFNEGLITNTEQGRLNELNALNLQSEFDKLIKEKNEVIAELNRLQQILIREYLN